MGYSNSKLVDYTLISPNRTHPRTGKKIDIITIHCVVGQCTVESLGQVFYPEKRHASSNYGVGYDGRIGLYVPEEDASWCSSSTANDKRAVTIEVASDTTYPFAIYPAALKSLIDLVADICIRNDIKELKWKNDKSLLWDVEKQNVTVHKWFADTYPDCPGDYICGLLPYIVKEANMKITNKSNFMVQVGTVYESESNALKISEALKKDGYDTCVVCNAELSEDTEVPCGDSDACKNLYNHIYCQKGDHGDYVVLIQSALLDKHYDLGKCGIDGSFGGATTAALKKFQSDLGIPQTGKVDIRTLTLLVR